MAACWAAVGAHMIPYWWTLAIPTMSSAGAATYPIRQPVMAYAFEKPPIRTDRSRMPGRALNAVCRWSPYTRRS